MVVLSVGIVPCLCVFFFSSRRRHTSCALVTGVQTCALPISPPVLAGYCLGGTMALAAACAMPVAGLAMIAAPWRFAGFSDRARGDIASLWQSAEPACAALGLVPMEVLQTGFWRLDPGRTIANYERFGRLDPDKIGRAHV